MSQSSFYAPSVKHCWLFMLQLYSAEVFDGTEERYLQVTCTGRGINVVHIEKVIVTVWFYNFKQQFSVQEKLFCDRVLTCRLSAQLSITGFSSKNPRGVHCVCVSYNTKHTRYRFRNLHTSLGSAGMHHQRCSIQS